MHNVSALGAALYHDVSLAEDTKPVEALLDAVLVGEAGLRQFCVPIAPRKEAPSKFRPDKLYARARRGELFSVLVRTAVAAHDEDVVSVSIGLVPTTPAAKEGRAGYRYQLGVVVGAAAVTRHGVGPLIDALTAFASAVPLRAGVVLPAHSAALAGALASGAASSVLTAEENKRAGDIFYSVYELGDRIRGPEWGTFLAAHHIAKLDGLEHVSSICAIVRPLPGGGAYVQLTERADDPELESRRSALAAVLAPVM